MEKKERGLIDSYYSSVHSKKNESQSMPGSKSRVTTYSMTQENLNFIDVAYRKYGSKSGYINNLIEQDRIKNKDLDQIAQKIASHDI